MTASDYVAGSRANPTWVSPGCKRIYGQIGWTKQRLAGIIEQAFNYLGMTMDISTVRVIVTGGASGLGEACVRGFAEHGARVAIFDRDADRGAALAGEIGGSVGFHAVDVTDESSVQAAIQSATEDMGGVSALINCAGIANGIKTLGRDGPFPLADFSHVVDINLIGTFNVLRLVAVEMAKNQPNEDGERGVIVNTASAAAFDGQKGQAAYSASKSGVAGMTLPIARDLAYNGIRICTIAPGLFLTPMFDTLGPEIAEALAKDVPFPKRLGRPSEFAHLARFIVENPYMNGETIRLDGAVRLP